MKLFDKALPNYEGRLREIVTSLGRHGRILLVITSPRRSVHSQSRPSPPVSPVATWTAGHGRGRGPAHGRSENRRPGRVHLRRSGPGLPQTLRSIQIADEQLAELTMLCGFDDDLVKQATATSNQIQGLLTQIHPAL